MPVARLPESECQDERGNDATEFGKPPQQPVALIIDAQAHGRNVQNHSGVGIHDPTPDKRAEQNILEQPAEDPRVDYGVDHVFGLVGNGQDVEPDQQHNDHHKSVALRLVKGNDVISNLLRKRMRDGRLHEETGVTLCPKIALPSVNTVDLGRFFSQ